MHQRISKKIILYLFLFFSLVTINNSKSLNLNLLKISKLNILGLEDFEKNKFYQDLNYLKDENILFIDKEEISKRIFTNKIVENLFVFKNYPSKIEIKIIKANFLAITKKNNKDFYIGTNGNFILANDPKKKLPFIFGDVDPEYLLTLKSYIDNSEFSFNKIKNLYFFKSKRWDIETVDGLLIKLPLKQVDVSLRILSNIINQEEFKNKKEIDLRQINQVIVNE
mgnify:CR=1 FL=1|tara:strand:- start:573 stop:1244 length:672 start_codon:yes stop_codon:yes gene_type:complete